MLAPLSTSLRWAWHVADVLTGCVALVMDLATAWKVVHVDHNVFYNIVWQLEQCFPNLSGRDPKERLDILSGTKTNW